MEKEAVKILYRGGRGEIVEKKSRFIATLERIETEEEALAFIARMKKQYWDARHNCYAFVTGRNQELQRCSDDGEPNGTAGRPMLDVLLQENVHNLVVVVTRYFGGTLLGTGGLVRAYKKAVQEGLKNSIIIEKMQGKILAVFTDYNSVGKIQYILAQNKITTMDSVYTDKVEIKVMVPLVKLDELQEAITEGTNGTARFEVGETMEFGVVDGNVELLCN